MDPDELTGIVAAFLAAMCFGSYGVPMKGEAATRVDIDPLVFQSYKAFTVFATSSILICLNNFLADDTMAAMSDEADTESYWSFHNWTFSDFTWWAFVSAFFWVPGGTDGVYAIRRAGLAISVGIWSCVIVILSFVWGVLIFGEKQKSTLGAVGAMCVLCVGLFGIAYFSSVEVEGKIKGRAKKQEGECSAGETTPLVEQRGQRGEDEDSLDLKTFPHSGTGPHCHETIDIHMPAFSITSDEHATFHVSKYHVGLLMAVINGVLAATIMVPLHYAPSNTTKGVGYSMSFGIASWFSASGILVLDTTILISICRSFYSPWTVEGVRQRI